MKKKSILIMMISLSLVLLIGTSYALLKSKAEGNNSYVINIGNLEVQFEDSKTEELTIDNMYPMKDIEGLNQEDELVFVISNNGNIIAGYNVYIEETSNNPEFKDVIKYIVNKENKGYYEIKTLGKDKYIDKGAYIEAKEKKEYRVKLWLDESAGNTYMSTEDSPKIFKAKLIVEGLQANNIDTSVANEPKLVSNLIPVYYDEENQVYKKADKNNRDINYKWYDYKNKEAATAVKIQNNNSYIIDKENKTFAKGENHDMYFNGTSDYYNLGYNDYDFKNAISIVSRFKLISYPASRGYIMGNPEKAGFLWQILSNKHILFGLHVGGNYINIEGTKPIELDKWYTAVATYDNINMKLYLYENGKLIEEVEQALTGAIKASNAPIYLGANPNLSNPNDAFLNVIISDVFVYTDTLTDTEVEKYFTGEITSYPEDNLLISNKDIHSKEGHYTLVNDGIYFDGEDDYLNLGYANYDFKNSITLVLRVKFLLNGENIHIFGNWEGGGGGIIYHQKKIESNMYIGDNYIYVFDNKEYNDDTWYTIVVTYDGSEIKLYIDGEKVTSSSVSGNLKQSPEPLFLGGNPYNGGQQASNFSNITVSDAFVYTDALTEDEIKNCFTDEIKYYPKDNLLISYDEFKETKDIEEYYEKADNGVMIMTNDIEAKFKWIPRFQYDTNVKFIKGTEKPENTHLAFTYNNEEVLGYYVTDNDEVNIDNIEKVCNYHTITSEEVDAAKKLIPNEEIEYKKALSIF